MHKDNKIHRDLKMENIMVQLTENPNDENTARMVCKLTDFGFSKMLDKEGE